MSLLQLNDDNFSTEVLESDLPVLVDFYATWCGPCKALTPIVEKLAGEYEGKLKVGKLNIDEAPGAPSQFSVRAVPTIVSIVRSRKSSLTRISNATFRNGAMLDLRPRNTSVNSRRRPKVWASQTVILPTSILSNASRTASSFVGWIMAMTSFTVSSQSCIRYLSIRTTTL